MDFHPHLQKDKDNLSSEFKNLFGRNGGEIIQTKGESKWVVSKSRIQGVDLWKLENLISRGWHSVYKLALRDNWTQNSEGDSHKGVFSLVKVSWEREGGGVGGKEVINAKSTEIIVNDSNKVWLIMAQGQNSIYLMPIVRTPNWCDSESEGFDEKDLEKRKGAKKKIEEKGVADIARWTEETDTWKGWSGWRDSKLQKKIGNGFSITRKVALSGKGYQLEGWNQMMEKRFRGMESWWESNKSWLQMAGIGSPWTLYKNAEVLSFSGQSANVQRCEDVEHYFPLDLVVLGDSSGIKVTNPKGSESQQTITITDTISEVIGVRLDQVVISKNGIGDGSGRLLNWGTVGIPSITTELLK